MASSLSRVPTAHEVPDTSDEGDRLRTALEAVLAIPFTPGNVIEPLNNGIEIFPAMLDSIDRATESIDFETFVFWKGDIATRFVEALAGAASRGVRVRVLLDAVGCIPMTSDDRRVLIDSGVECIWFRPVARWRFWEINHRTHRKILVCDDEAFTGGVGIAQEWVGNASCPEQWRETHFRLRGPVVNLLRGAFLEHWIEGLEFSDSSRLEEALTPPPPVEAPHDRPGSALVQVITSGAGVGWTEVEKILHSLVANARRSIRITTAYFVPDDSLVTLLCSAAERGVEVEILHPGQYSDHRVCQLAGEDVYATLLDSGVRIFRYQPTMLHSKIITVDDEVSLIGSANFNHRSLRKDDEICLTVIDREFTARLNADFEKDRAKSRQVDTKERWNRRPIVQRMGELLARIVRSEL